MSDLPCLPHSHHLKFVALSGGACVAHDKGHQHGDRGNVGGRRGESG